MLPKMNFVDPALPKDIALRLEAMLYTAPSSTAAYVFGLVVMSGVIFARTGDSLLTAYAVVTVLLVPFRVGFVKHYRSTPDYLPILLGFGMVFSGLLAALVLRAFDVGDRVVIALASLAAAGYLSGVTIRAAAVPALAIPHASTLFAPLDLTASLSAEYWPVAILLTCYWVGTIHLISTMHARIRSQLVAEHLMARAASTDALTGLANRAAFDEALNQRLETGSAVVAMIDLDRFKPVNDTYGHDAGDELLKSVAARIVATLNNKHFSARLGGDEFAILFESEATIAEATLVAQNIVRALEAPLTIGEHNISIGASIGLAMAADGEDARTIKRRADDRLYSVKRNGRGHVLSEAAAAAA